MKSHAVVASISIYHTTGIIIVDTSKFSFVGSCPEAMFREVLEARKILEAYRELFSLGFRPLTQEMKSIIAEADKPKKGWGSKRWEESRKETRGARGSIYSNSSSKETKRSDLFTYTKESDTQSDVRLEEDDPVRNEDVTSNPEVTPTYNDFFRSPPHSPKTTTTTTPITVAPCPPPVSSQTLGSILLSTPLFSDSIAPPTPSIEPHVAVKESNATNNTSGFKTTHISLPISLLRQDDPDMIYGDGEDDFTGFTFSPFTIRNESDDEAPVMKGQLQAIHEKLDSLLHASKPLSTE
ncbi:unnamed protein product [Lactuca saligna]|uniref:Uncharacterized protein n=1 Tax=Lactuca saligna TaxID=75948 RepID=A0AA35V1K4_LACSI|nr:unnamed protein product [Lactuca saligna]